MIRLVSRRTTLIGQIILGYVFLSCMSASAAIGIYEFSASSSGSAPVHISYRLNCPGHVTIDILDQDGRVVSSLGGFDDVPGAVVTHDWDGAGAHPGVAHYKARIKAENPGSGEENRGKLERLFGGSISKSIYGLAVDRYPESPAYGTVYISDTTGYRIRAYHPDGTVKTEFGTNGMATLGFTAVTKTSPHGIGIDRLGQIYVACSGASTSKTGVKVFDYTGKEIEPYHVFASQAQGIFWLDGLMGPQGPEIYESYRDQIRACVIGDADWHTAIPAIPGTSTKQICFETGGQACYVAIDGISTDPANPNPGVVRYVRQTDGQWSRDAEFDCKLSTLVSSTITAAQLASGVSCDARVPNPPSRYGATSLWIALEYGNLATGIDGDIVRRMLTDDTMTVFKGPDPRGRIVAADSVGNVAIETASSTDAYWSSWGLYAPGGEASTDERTTGLFDLAGETAPKVVSQVDEAKNEKDGSLVELGAGKLVTAVFDGCFYIADSEHSSGLKVESAETVGVGSTLRVRGTLGTENGERVLKNGVVLAQ